MEKKARKQKKTKTKEKKIAKTCSFGKKETSMLSQRNERPNLPSHSHVGLVVVGGGLHDIDDTYMTPSGRLDLQSCSA